MADLFDAGFSMNVLARLFSVHRSAIARALQPHGVPRRTRGLTDEEAVEAGRLYQDGWSIMRLREKFGCSDSAVMTAFEKTWCTNPPAQRLATAELSRPVITAHGPVAITLSGPPSVTSMF